MTIKAKTETVPENGKRVFKMRHIRLGALRDDLNAFQRPRLGRVLARVKDKLKARRDALEMVSGIDAAIVLAGWARMLTLQLFRGIRMLRSIRQGVDRNNRRQQPPPGSSDGHQFEI